jgi:hypothetical protein
MFKNLSKTHIIELIAFAIMLIGAVMISYYYITANDNRVSEICKINSFGNKEGIGPLIRHLVGHGRDP